MTYAALETAAKKAGYSVECVENTRFGVLVFRVTYGKYHIRKSVYENSECYGLLDWDHKKANLLKMLLRQVALMPFDEALREAEKESTRQ